MPEAPDSTAFSKPNIHLTDRLYWDSVHHAGGEIAPLVTATAPGRRSWLRRLVPSVITRLGGGSYAQDRFWSELLPRFVPQQPGATVVEIGVAPGDEVLEFHKRFGYRPFGVEYSPVGAETTRKNFDAHGIDPDNVLEGDLFSDDFIARHESRFDVVFSRGLIEHFTNPVDAIHRHARLAKPGGLVIITIPTLTGIHYALTRILMPHQIPIHNRAIMRLKPFRRLFDQPDLEPLFCDYFGGLNLGIAYNPDPKGFRAGLQWLVLKLQILANMAGRVGGARLMRGGYLNGALVFIGRRRS